MTEHKARRIYSAEELHRLRGSCSAPKLSEAIEEHVAEDAELVKEHILRGSRSFAARSFRSRNGLNSLRASSERSHNENISVTSLEQARYPPSITERSVLAEVPPNNQFYRNVTGRFRISPTPSVKRKKVEDLVKAHGSPQHVRVTAGGRIVPSEQSPLCFPRFGYSAIKANGGLVKFAPGHQQGKTPQWTEPLQDGSQQGYIAQDTEGRLCQIVDGIVLPLAEFNGAFHLYLPAPNLSIGANGYGGPGQPLSESVMDEHQRITDAVPPVLVQPATAATQMPALEAEYTQLELSLRELDKTEVIHGRTMGRAAKEQLVQRRRMLVVGMDRIRKTIKAIRERPAEHDRPQTPQLGPRSEHASVSPSSTVHHVRQHNNGGPPPSASYYGYPALIPVPAGVHDHANGVMNASYAMPSLGYWMPPPAFDGMPGWLPPYQQFAGTMGMPEHMPPAQRDGAYDPPKTVTQPSSPRQSHALPVRDPETKQAFNVKSLLNPMSPVYKPAVDGHNGSNHSSITNRAVNQRIPTPMSFAGEAGAKHVEGDDAVNTSSGSSIRTLDFFPQNAREHSMRKHEYPVSADNSSKENTGPRNSDRTGSEPSTTHHESDWNPDISSRAFKKTVVSPKAPPGTPVKATKQGDRESLKPSPQRVDAVGTIDFSNKPRAWIEGYQAGLLRKPVPADRIGSFLDGYCSGLLKSQPHSVDEEEPLQPVEQDHMMRRNAVASVPPMPGSLKQAVFAPTNEVAVLSPAPDGPTVTETGFHLGTWQNKHDTLMSAAGQGLSGYPFPDRQSSLPHAKAKGEAKGESGNKKPTIDVELANAPLRQDFSWEATPRAAHGDDAPGIASIVHNKRVVTPLEWRTRSSLANIANLTSSFFSQSQIDGLPGSHDDREPMLNNAAGIAGFTADHTSRFREASLDGISPPTSPILSEQIAAPVSPRSSAMKRFRERHTSPKVSPMQISPAKQGSGTRVSKSSPQKSGAANDSSPSKYRWKDIWRHRNISGRPGTP